MWLTVAWQLHSTPFPHSLVGEDFCLFWLYFRDIADMAATTTAATRRIDSIKDEIDELKKKLALLGQNRLHNQHYI